MKLIDISRPVSCALLGWSDCKYIANILTLVVQGQ